MMPQDPEQDPRQTPDGAAEPHDPRLPGTEPPAGPPAVEPWAGPPAPELPVEPPTAPLVAAEPPARQFPVEPPTQEFPVQEYPTVPLPQHDTLPLPAPVPAPAPPQATPGTWSSPGAAAPSVPSYGTAPISGPDPSAGAQQPAGQQPPGSQPASQQPASQQPAAGHSSASAAQPPAVQPYRAPAAPQPYQPSSPLPSYHQQPSYLQPSYPPVPYRAPVGVGAGVPPSGWGPAGGGEAGGVGDPAGGVPTPTRPPRRFSWLTVAVAAVVAALVGSGAAAATVAATGNGSTHSASIATLGQSTTSTVPVSGSSTAAPNWQKVAAAVKPSVVAITVTTSQGEAEGSGVVIDSSGHVITNDHVVDGATDGKVQVTLSDGRIYDGTVKGTDATTDLAIVQLTNPPSDLTPAALGDSSTLVVGQQVLAVGNPLGLQNTVTSGIVSALNRPVSTATSSDGSSGTVVTNAIQVDAAINPGNSGGPLFDGDGTVVGITSSIATLSESSSSDSQSGSIGLGFAIPVNLVKNIGSQLISSGTAQHAFLGVRLDDGQATADGVTRAGAKVVQVTSGSPADKAGVQTGDVIVAFGDQPTPGADSLTGFVRAMSAGDQVTLTLVRGGKSLKVDTTLAARQEDATSRG